MGQAQIGGRGPGRPALEGNQAGLGAGCGQRERSSSSWFERSRVAAALDEAARRGIWRALRRGRTKGPDPGGEGGTAKASGSRRVTVFSDEVARGRSLRRRRMPSVRQKAEQRQRLGAATGGTAPHRRRERGNKWRWPERDGALVDGDGSRADPGGHDGRRSIAGFPGGNLVKRDRIQRLEEQEMRGRESRVALAGGSAAEEPAGGGALRRRSGKAATRRWRGRELGRRSGLRESGDTAVGLPRAPMGSEGLPAGLGGRRQGGTVRGTGGGPWLAPGGWEAARTNGSTPLGGRETMWRRQVARRERGARKWRWEVAETARRKGKLRLGVRGG